MAGAPYRNLLVLKTANVFGNININLRLMFVEKRQIRLASFFYNNRDNIVIPYFATFYDFKTIRHQQAAQCFLCKIKKMISYEFRKKHFFDYHVEIRRFNNTDRI